MATEFRWFRSTATGKTGLYPARFASRPTFVEIGSEEAQCLDCLPSVETVDENELFYDDASWDDEDDSETEEI